MNITTKYETGSIVYAVHPCRLICGGQIILNGEMHGMEPGGADQNQAHADDIYIVSPHKVRNITVSCGKNDSTEIWYELSGGVIRSEKDLFASFEDAAVHAAGLYEKSVGENSRSGKREGNSMLKEIVFCRIKHELELILTNAQMESLEEEFMRATQGLVFSEA